MGGKAVRGEIVSSTIQADRITDRRNESTQYPEGNASSRNPARPTATFISHPLSSTPERHTIHRSRSVHDLSTISTVSKELATNLVGNRDT